LLSIQKRIATSLHVKLADEAICIGEARSKDSYLNMNRVLSAAISTGCNAIHPGYGFLSENSEFVEMVESCQIQFIGPTSKTIQMIGDKAAARDVLLKNMEYPLLKVAMVSLKMHMKD
jgi:acetyl-CoA carboxylase, biotin carboxylase subunit